jgi:hypothetical protein
VDKEQFFLWLKFGDMKGKTESIIVTAEDQASQYKYFKGKIKKKIST